MSDMQKRLPLYAIYAITNQFIPSHPILKKMPAVLKAEHKSIGAELHRWC
ncbi:hypothetical protein SNOG_08220 [Parastagonospora nodorum SN15]|uniref:Uncharacterized protein n=1 Tax=Phaeosphaeria nodorum (strain SN15 / ATCC MYA-4574 / FGSC 10173) TaxID=321614 RepID=Q0UJ44_PHANO|nr:hypothetical protein SNOG_08220 [Parastagonospora nodorum SN15]EAT84496.1 hypothetical protein SNOG_08220 [Parastagonospora nodorum SN15]